MQLYYCYNNSYLSTNTLKSLQGIAEGRISKSDFEHLDILKCLKALFVPLNILKCLKAPFSTLTHLVPWRDWEQDVLLDLFYLLKCLKS